MHAAIERNSWRIPQDDIVQVVSPKSKLKLAPDELAYAGLSDGQYWRSVILALLVIGMVIAGIATAIKSYGFVDELLYWSGQLLTLDHIFNGNLTPQRLPSMWVSSTGFVYQLDDGNLALLNITTNITTILIANHTLNQLNVKGYKCSYDMNYILLKHDIKQVYKNTYTAHYTIYTTSNDHQTAVSINGSDVKISELQSVEWAGVTNSLIVVENNNIYIKYEWNHSDVRITNDGIPGVIYNGIPDWLYQEEIFVDPEKAYWSSADGSFLLYASLNDSLVQNFEYPSMDDNLQNKDLSKFPATKSIRYPTPGTNIPSVRLWIANITKDLNTNHTSIEIQPPPTVLGQDFYLTSAGWVNDSNSRICVAWMSRTHNLSIITYCEAPDWKCAEKHVENATPKMWLEVQHHPIFAADGQSYLLLAMVQESGTYYYTQIKHVTLKNKHVLTLSHGRYEVLKILSWDTINHIVYYLGTDEGNTGKQHLYSVNDQTTAGTELSEPKCITCSNQKHMKKIYGECSHFSAYFSPAEPQLGVQYYFLECNGPTLPMGGIHFAANNSLWKLLYSPNKSLKEYLNDFALPTSVFENVPLGNSHTARVQLLLPPSWRRELRDAAFPVIVQVNGQPNSQSVSTKWNVDWGMVMSSSKGVIYIQLDVRGSKGQSTEDMYRRLGDIEVEDQMTVIEKLLHPYKMDVNRIGVWGWGYGGYVTTLLMNKQYKVFKCGIAVSPIADWSYYNTAFVEKILGLKTESNSISYVNADITKKTKTKQIESNTLYIIQGLADLSVPYQHGIMLSKGLTNSGVLFQHQVYANEGHYFGDVEVLKHMYQSMEEYFAKCLTLDEDDLMDL